MPMIGLVRSTTGGGSIYFNTAVIESLERPQDEDGPDPGRTIVRLTTGPSITVEGQPADIAARINDAERRALGGGDR